MVIVAVSGEECSGKKTWVEHFANHFSFEILHLESPSDLKPELAKALIKDYFLKDIIVYPITSIEQYNLLAQKHYFTLYYINCPPFQRLSLYEKKHEKRPEFSIFLQSSPQTDLIQKSLIVENKENLEQFYKSIENISIQREFRPKWDPYFMKLAHIIKTRSNCIKRAVGVVVVKNKRIVATGYNGTPSAVPNCFEGGCERCAGDFKQGQALDECFCVHAEENAILEIGTPIILGIQNMRGGIIFTTTFPCLMCAKLLISAQVTRVIYSEDYDGNRSQKFFQQAGVEITQIHI